VQIVGELGGWPGPFVQCENDLFPQTTPGRYVCVDAAAHDFDAVMADAVTLAAAKKG